MAVLGSKARAASLAADGPRSLLAPEPEINAQSEYKRQVPGGLQAWQGPELTLPTPGCLPPRACWRAETLGPREHRPALEVPSTLYGQGHGTCQPPASSGLKARLEAAVTSTLQILSSLVLLRIRPHISAPNWLRDAEQGATFHWALLFLSVKGCWGWGECGVRGCLNGTHQLTFQVCLQATQRGD